MADEANAKMLTDVQAAAMAAMDAAKMASDDAADDAETAMDATMHIATLQTGEMSVDMAMAAQTAAKAAMDAYRAAKKASDTAHADDATVETATTARDMAVAEQAKAEAAAMTAMKQSEGAVKYAMSELIIAGTMKSVGESSIDAKMGALIDTAADGSKTLTGEVSKVINEVAEVEGRAFDSEGTRITTDDVQYRQAVAADLVPVAKVLDTRDDKARLTLVHSRAGTKNVRVYVEKTSAITPTAAVPASGTEPIVPPTEEYSPADLHIQTDSRGQTRFAHAAVLPTADVDFSAYSSTPGVRLSPAGMHYKATDTDAAGTGAADMILDHTDLVEKRVSTPDGMDYDVNEVFSYKHSTIEDSTRDDSTQYVVETFRRVQNGVTTVTYQHVDVKALAAPDNPATAEGVSQQIRVRAAIPTAIEYEHLHFGTWANLGEADKKGLQKLTDLGIGFVQSIGDGMTDTQLVGTIVFNGDWVGTVRTSHNEKLFKPGNGAAMLKADFDKDEFTGVLTGLATLEGTLSGNGFSGTKVMDIEHADLDERATFKGMFEGGIYGPEGEEAGGIFDFSSTAGGAFRGAMGGARDIDN